MTEWWANLTGLNQGLYIAAAFFSLFFLWQLITTFIGIGGGLEDVTSHVDAAVDHSALDATADAAAHESVLAFKLLSLRSVLAFLTLFSWASALYIDAVGMEVPWAMLYGCLWGSGAMVLVALAFHMFMKMTISGNLRMTTCLNTNGTVYLDIPSGGTGEVRVLVSGVMTHIRARARGGAAMKAGTSVTVNRILDATTVEVVPTAETNPNDEARMTNQ